MNDEPIEGIGEEGDGFVEARARCGEGCRDAACNGTCGRQKGHTSGTTLRMHKCWHCKKSWLGG